MMGIFEYLYLYLNMDIVIQIFILVFGGTGIWLVGRVEPWRKWGFVLGLAGQPFWLCAAIRSRQWGIFLLSCFYFYAWGQGVWFHFVKGRRC